MNIKVQHAKWMARAIELARRGEGLTRPNPPVGAVLVKGGRIIAEGYHRRAGGAHAEKAALAAAGARAKGSTLYVTLEPCCTWGRTGPCTDLVIAAGVRHVVVSRRDPNPVHRGRGLRELRRHGIRVTRGVLAEEGEGLIRPFTKWVSSGLPYLTLKLGMTIDGRIADAAGRSRWITGAAARAAVQEMRRGADAIMVGANTTVLDNPRLTVRPARGRRPWRVIVDSRGRTPLSAKVLTDESVDRTLMAVTGMCPARRQAAYRKAGAEVLVLGTRNGRVDLRALLRELGRRGVLHVLCEGGGELAAGLIQAGCVDELALFYSPSILGGGGSRPGVGGRWWPLADCPQWQFLSVQRVGRDILVRGAPAGGPGRRKADGR